MQTDFSGAECSFFMLRTLLYSDYLSISSSEYVLSINHNLTWLCFVQSKLQPRKHLHFSVRDESVKLVDGKMEIGGLLFVGRTCVLLLDAISAPVLTVFPRHTKVSVTGITGQSWLWSACTFQEGCWSSRPPGRHMLVSLAHAGESCFDYWGIPQELCFSGFFILKVECCKPSAYCLMVYLFGK
jgi:hypothetical protein